MKARVIFLLCLLAIVGCEGPAFFTSPLSEPGQVPYDKRLIGIWYSWDPEEELVLPMYFSIRPKNEHQLIGLAVVTDNSEKRLYSNLYAVTLHPSTVNEETYYNVGLPYSLALAYQKDGTLKLEQSKRLDMDQPDLTLVYVIAKIELVNEEWVIVNFLGEKGAEFRLEGSGRMTTMGEQTVFDASAGDLHSFIGATDPSLLFSNSGSVVYHRLEPLAMKKAPPAVKERFEHWKKIVRWRQGREASS